MWPVNGAMAKADRACMLWSFQLESSTAACSYAHPWAVLHSAAQIFHAGIVVCRSAMRVQHTLGRTRVHDGMLQLPNTGSGFGIKAANSNFRRLQLG